MLKAITFFARTLLFLVLAGSSVSAQTTLRIGLAEDPDVLDPTLSRTYVGKIVFASICDKLFDIDESLNPTPQLALAHQTSPDGKVVTITLRPGVSFHDGEPFDAEAAKFSLDRHASMPGSFRKPEIAALERVEIVDSLTIRLLLKESFSPLISQLADRAGIMISPKAAKEAGEKFGLKPVCAGPYKFVERVQQDRIVVERFQDYWDKTNTHIERIVYLPIPDATVRLANLKSGGVDLLERLLATDIDQVRSDPRLKLASALETGYQGLRYQCRPRRAFSKPARHQSESPPGTQSRDRPRRDYQGGLQRRIRARQPMGSPISSVLSGCISGSGTQSRQGQGADG